MKVTLEEHTNPINLGKYAGICYGREGNDEKRLAHIIGVGHLSVLRFGSAVFRIEGISRVCLDQLTRSKRLDYLMRIQDAFQLYKELRGGGFTKQDARYILPQAQETELYVCGNYQAWVDFIKLRASKSAQLEVREVVLEIERQLKEISPIIFGEANE